MIRAVGAVVVEPPLEGMFASEIFRLSSEFGDDIAFRGSILAMLLILDGEKS